MVQQIGKRQSAEARAGFGKKLAAGLGGGAVK
jgi:hypothetical protein